MVANRPLGGRTIVVTRPEHQANEMVNTLSRLGAEALQIPAIRIRTKPDLSELDRSLRDLESYDWLIFTSVNGVRITLDRHDTLGLEPSELRKLRLASIGPATADALRERGLDPEFIPESFVAEEFAAGIPDADGRRFLLPRAEGARPVLPETLRARGASVDEVLIYEAVRADADQTALQRLQNGVDAITFTSPSTAESFSETVLMSNSDPTRLPGDPLIACIGPITASAAERLGYSVGVVASRYTSQGLVDALVEHFSKDASNGSR